MRMFSRFGLAVVGTYCCFCLCSMIVALDYLNLVLNTDRAFHSLCFAALVLCFAALVLCFAALVLVKKSTKSRADDLHVCWLHVCWLGQFICSLVSFDERRQLLAVVADTIDGALLCVTPAIAAIADAVSRSSNKTENNSGQTTAVD